MQAAEGEKSSIILYNYGSWNLQLTTGLERFVNGYNNSTNGVTNSLTGFKICPVREI